jgi:hypothetical protein
MEHLVRNVFGGPIRTIELAFCVLEGCAHPSARCHELDDWGVDARSSAYSAGAFHQSGGVTGGHPAAAVKRGLVYRLLLFFMSLFGVCRPEHTPFP